MGRPQKLTLLLVSLAAGAGLAWLLSGSGFFAAVRSVQALRDYIDAFAPYSHLCFFLLQLLCVVFAPIPSNLCAAAGGVLFGVWVAFPLTIGAVLAGTMLVFTLARTLGRSFVERVVSRKISGKYLDLIRSKTGIFLALAFLLPFFPDDILCILAGLTSISPRRFFLIALLARPWGLLAASALGGTALDLHPLGLAALAAAGLALFLLGMKYGDRAEQAVLRALRGDGKREKNS